MFVRRSFVSPYTRRFLEQHGFDLFFSDRAFPFNCERIMREIDHRRRLLHFTNSPVDETVDSRSKDLRRGLPRGGWILTRTVDTRCRQRDS